MINKDKVKGYILGLVTATLLCSTAAFAESISKTVTAVYNNIKIVVNGNEITPTDVNGNTVEPFIIDGTTYLPVRAIANALGQDVNWHGATNTVYIGTLPSDMQYQIDSQALVPYTHVPLASVGDININGSLYNINMVMGLTHDYLSGVCDNFSPFSSLQEMTVNSSYAPKKFTDALTNSFHSIYAVYNELDKTGYLNDEKIKTGMDAAWINYTSQFDSDEDMQAFFNETASSSEDFKFFVRANEAVSLYSDYLLSDLISKGFTLDEITKAVKEDYVKVKHILVDDEKTALEIIQSLGYGASFDSLIEKHNLDSGQGTDGYTFTRGEMVPEFENAAYALSVNEYTKTPVKSAYGYHIIYRYDIDSEWISKNKTSLTESVSKNKISNIFKTLTEKYPVVYTSDYEKYISVLK